jgi:hypothetical protein
MFEKADELRSFWRWSATTAGIFLLYSLIRIFTGIAPEVNSLVLPMEFPVWLAWIPAAINAGAFVAIFMLLIGNKKSQSFLLSIDDKDDYIVAAFSGLVMSLVFSNVYSMDGIIIGSLLLGLICVVYLGWVFEPYAALAYMAVIGWSHNLLVQTGDHGWLYSLFVSPIEAVGGAIWYLVIMIVAAVAIAYTYWGAVWAFKFCFPEEEDEIKPVPDKIEPLTTVPSTKPTSKINHDTMVLPDSPDGVADPSTHTPDNMPDLLDDDAEYAEAGAADMAANLDNEAASLIDAGDGPEVVDTTEVPTTDETETPNEDATPEVVDEEAVVTPPVETDEAAPAEETTDTPVETATEDTTTDEVPEKK